MIEGTTRSGFVFCVDDAVADNMELVDAIADTSEDDPLAFSRVCRLLLGNEQRKRLYDHLRAADGRVPLAAVSEALADVMAAFPSGKN